MNIVGKWLSVFLSGITVLFSIVNNLFIAWLLSSLEFNKWIACTSLLPLISILVSPFASSALRHESTATRGKQVAITSLILLNAVSFVLAAIGAIIGLTFLRLDLAANIILWLSMTCKVALESVLSIPEIFGCSLSDKIWRVACPSFVLIALVGLRPNSFFEITMVSAAVSVGSSFVFILFKGRFVWADVGFSEMLHLYCGRWKYGAISILSLGVFCVPLYLYSLRGLETTTAFLGVAMNLLNGAVAFVTLVHNREIPKILEDLLVGRITHYRVCFKILGWAILSAIGTLMVMLSFLHLKNVQYSIASLLFASLLVLVETYQVVITSILLRAGSTSMLRSAFISSTFNITVSMLVADINIIILSMAASQIIAYIIPGNRLLHGICKIRGRAV